MPRNAIMNHMLTIYMLALFPVSTTVHNPSSSIVWRFIGTNSRKKFIVWYLLLCVKVHLSWTKLGLADPFLRNRNSAFRCGVHIETLLFKWRIFSYFRLKLQYPDKRAAIFDLAVLARHSQRVSLSDVTAHGRIQDWPSRERLGTRLMYMYIIDCG